MGKMNIFIFKGQNTKNTYTFLTKWNIYYFARDAKFEYMLG